MYRTIGKLSHLQPVGVPEPTGRGWHRGRRLANPLLRICAATPDYAPPAVAVWHLGWFGFAVGVLWIFWSTVWMQSLTGQSLGKVLFGLTLVVPVLEDKTSRPFLIRPSASRLCFRSVCHLADAFLFLGVVVLINSPKRQCLADRAAETLVLRSSSVVYAKVQGAPDPIGR